MDVNLIKELLMRYHAIFEQKRRVLTLLHEINTISNIWVKMLLNYLYSCIVMGKKTSMNGIIKW